MSRGSCLTLQSFVSQVEKHRDNILPRIMASSEGHTSLFERELSKYDGLKGAGSSLLTGPSRQFWHVLLLRPPRTCSR